MKKLNDIELKIYEFIGIRYFKRFVIFLVDNITKIFLVGAPKDEKIKIIHSGALNYYIGNVKSLEKVSKFKKWLIFNSTIHIYALCDLIPNFIKIGAGAASNSTIILTLIATVINSYCVILQRYNWVRINQAVDKVKPYYDSKKSKIIEKMREDDLTFGGHSYKIVKSNGKEKSVTFEDIVSRATLEELKVYRYNLEYFKQTNDFNRQFREILGDQTSSIDASLDDNKTLVLELKFNKDSANNKG